MRAELMQEYRHCQTCPSRDHWHRLVQEAVGCWGDREPWGHALSLCLSSASDWPAQPYGVDSTSLFCFLLPLFQPSFLSYLCSKPSPLPAFWLFCLIGVFLLNLFPCFCFSSLVFSATHFHPGVSFFPAVPSVSAHLLCSSLSKLVLPPCCVQNSQPNEVEGVLNEIPWIPVLCSSLLLIVSGSFMLPSLILCFLKWARTEVKGRCCREDCWELSRDWVLLYILESHFLPGNFLLLFLFFINTPE